MLNRDERGMTLVEVVIASLITGVLSLAVVGAITTVQTALASSTGQTISAVQTARFASLLKYDVAGASDVYVHGATVPGNPALVCSTWDALNPAAWTDQTDAGFVRALFTLRIPTVTPPTSAGQLVSFLPTRGLLVGYEVRRIEPGSPKFELARVTCDAGRTSERLLSLGTSLAPSATGISSILCFNALGASVPLIADASTMSTSLPDTQRCTSFAFAVPSTSTSAAIRRIRDDATLQRLTPVVTAS